MFRKSITAARRENDKEVFGGEQNLKKEESTLGSSSNVRGDNFAVRIGRNRPCSRQ